MSDCKEAIISDVSSASGSDTEDDETINVPKTNPPVVTGADQINTINQNDQNKESEGGSTGPTSDTEGDKSDGNTKKQSSASNDNNIQDQGDLPQADPPSLAHMNPSSVWDVIETSNENMPVLKVEMALADAENKVIDQLISSALNEVSSGSESFDDSLNEEELLILDEMASLGVDQNVQGKQSESNEQKTDESTPPGEVLNEHGIKAPTTSSGSEHDSKTGNGNDEKTGNKKKKNRKNRGKKNTQSKIDECFSSSPGTPIHDTTNKRPVTTPESEFSSVAKEIRMDDRASTKL